MGLFSYLGHRITALVLLFVAVYLIVGSTVIAFLAKYETACLCLGAICFIASLYYFQTKHNSKESDR